MSLILGFIEIYNSYIHGDIALDGTFLVFEILYDRDIKNLKYENTCTTEHIYINSVNLRLHSHNTIRNYRAIIENKYFNNMRFIECYQAEDGELLAIDKTCFIKILQRKWKNIYKRRQSIYKRRRNPREIYNKLINGKWSETSLW